MSRILLVLAVLVSRISWAQAPAYTANSIVNASDYSPGPFSPNSVLSIFGTNLSWYTADFSSGKSAASSVPLQLSGVQVIVDTYPAPILYVSPSQINFLILSGEKPGNSLVTVVREGWNGPTVTLPLVNGAPALFDDGAGFAIATHLDGAVLSDASPAQPGEFVVIYATGLGATDPNPQSGEVPMAAALIQYFSTLSISLNGVALPPSLIYYAGVCPGYAGLYQINIQLPQDVPSDPVIQVFMGTQTSSTRLKIAVQ